MHEAWWKISEAERSSVSDALREHAPLMRLVEADNKFFARGPFELIHDGETIGRFLIEIEFEPSTSAAAHKVTETAGRIPRILDRHVNADGTCCTGVYGEWELSAPSLSFSAFLNGPVRDFFLSQIHFEAHGVWPFDERPHGLPGMVESYAELLGVANREELVADTLAFLRLDEPKGHWHCPCGSGAQVRGCCRSRLAAIKQKWGSAGVEKIWTYYINLKRLLDPNATKPQFSKT